MENHHVQWQNQRTQWQCSIANTKKIPEMFPISMSPCWWIPFWSALCHPCFNPIQSSHCTLKSHENHIKSTKKKSNLPSFGFSPLSKSLLNIPLNPGGEGDSPFTCHCCRAARKLPSRDQPGIGPAEERKWMDRSRKPLLRKPVII